MGCNLALVGAYVLAGELKSAQGDYAMAYKRYNEVMLPLVSASQALAPWMGECFLAEDDVSKETLVGRSIEVIEKIKLAANAVSLPDYD